MQPTKDTTPEKFMAVGTLRREDPAWRRIYSQTAVDVVTGLGCGAGCWFYCPLAVHAQFTESPLHGDLFTIIAAPYAAVKGYYYFRHALQRGTHLQRLHRLSRCLSVAIRLSDWESVEVMRHVQDACLMSSSLLCRLGSFGLNLMLANTTCSQMHEESFPPTEEPRGWQGYTWNALAGGYNATTKIAAVGSGLGEPRGICLHELAHGLDHMLGRVSHGTDMEAHHRRLFSKVSPYEQQEGLGGLTGRREMFACGIALLLKSGRQDAIARYDAEYIRWLEGILAS